MEKNIEGDNTENVAETSEQLSEKSVPVASCGSPTETKQPQETFKKPVLIGKIGRLPRKIVIVNKLEEDETCPTNTETKDCQQNSTEAQTFAIPDLKKPVQIGPKPTPQALSEVLVPLPYQEPQWSGLPQSSSKKYSFEVLKSGSIIERIEVMDKPFWVFGRSALADLYMAHPTVSRCHAILQYRKEAAANEPVGFYLYDLGSTHGTFLNKARLKSRVYARVQVGHMIKLGCSTRSYILTGPEEDEEDESEHGVTELQKLRAEELAKRADEAKETEEKEKAEAEARRKKEVEQGIDWGLGEDADEKMDLTDNPFAQTNNEELYIDDPKKALRGFMEREGHDLDYDCSEQGFGQFLCKVELPLDDEFGRPIVAEVLHKGKKKEAVFQCALEACKILDRYGVLRKATHESRKRKPRNWEENDYYDSDEDTFLDRTGTIEKKREKRKQATQPQQPETYQTLIVKEKELSEQIQEIEKQLYESNKRNTSDASSTDADSLDSFMKELKQSKPDKQTIRKLKTDHVRLKAEHDRIVRLANLAKPTDMPALVSWDQKPQTGKTSAFSGSQKAKTLPMFGKRLKVKVQVPVHNKEMDVDADGEEKEDETNEVPETEILRVEATNTPTDKQNDAEPKTEDTANMVEGEECDEETPEEREKRRKRNQKRIQQRKEKAEMERQRAYKLDSHRQGYDMWVPPSNQTGDGRTSLNDKLGY